MYIFAIQGCVDSNNCCKRPTWIIIYIRFDNDMPHSSGRHGRPSSSSSFWKCTSLFATLNPCTDALALALTRTTIGKGLAVHNFSGSSSRLLTQSVREHHQSHTDWTACYFCIAFYYYYSSSIISIYPFLGLLFPGSPVSCAYSAAAALAAAAYPSCVF